MWTIITTCYCLSLSSTCVRSTQEQNVSNNLPSFIPTCFVSGLGIVEHSVVMAELADSSPAVKRYKIRG